MTAAYAELLELLWVAPLAVLIVATTFSLGLLGATRAGEHRRAGEVVAASAYGALAVLSAVVFTAAVVAGIAVIVLG